MNIGINGASCDIAKKIMTSDDIAYFSGMPEKYIFEKLGFKEKRIAESNEHPSDFAIRAVKSVLHTTRISPEDINCIIYCSSGIYDYQFWSPSSYIQDTIDAKNALTFEINNGCNSATMGMFLAENLMKSQSWEYALVIISDTLSKFIDYSDHDLFPLFSFSDGAAAIIVQKNCDNHTILAQALHSDGEYANCNKIIAGGTHYTALKNFTINDMYIKLENKDKIKKLRENIIENAYIKVINKSLEIAGINHNDLSLVLTNQNTKKIIRNVFKRLGIPKEKSYSTIEKYGHLGGVDTFFALEACLKKQFLKKGDLVLLATAGIGFNWGAQIICI